MGWALYCSWVFFVLGLALAWSALRGRRVRGLGPGETLSLDDVDLHSEKLGLAGRPDRIVREGGRLIPEEWKSSKRINHGHRLQLGAYFLLIEEAYGVRPPHGFVVLGDASRVLVENADELRSEVLDVARRIRERRRILEAEIQVDQPAWKCRACGQRKNCGRAGS